jgi:hypothetical protein
VDEPTTRHTISRDVYNDVMDLSANVEYAELSDGLLVALECATFGKTTATLQLDDRQAATLASYLEHQTDHPFFYGRERYVERLVARLRGAAPSKPRPSNSLGSWSTAEFVRHPRQPHRLLYRGAMPADLVRLVETVAWELRMTTLPRITYRIGDPDGRLLRTHLGGASGRYTLMDEHITLTAGPDALRVKGTLLHELAHWLSRDSTPHGPAFYRYLIALFRRYDVPMSYLNWEGDTKAVREGRARLRRRPLIFRRTPRPTVGSTTPPIAPKKAKVQTAAKRRSP